LSAIQHRLASLSGRSSGYIAALPEPIKQRVKALQKLQKSHDGLSRDLEREIRELETKYRKRYAPLYEKRASIISGEYEPTAEECVYDEKDSIDNVNEPATVTAMDEEKVSPPPKVEKGIPEFWLTALKQMPLVDEAITEFDEDALKFLTDIQVAYHPDMIVKLYILVGAAQKIVI
jgi:nucleosome assembly protein 1-like 1